MIKWLKKYKWIILGVIILYVLYFSIRFYRLTSLPIFTDEAIYIRWSQIGSRDAAWRFISLTDGKQPLFTWIMMGLFKIIHADPLFIGRLVSVGAGSITLAGIMTLGFVLFGSSTISLIAGLLYVISPFSTMYDRLALYDSLVAGLWIWGIIGEVIIVKTLRLDIALLTGMIVGAAILNKSSGFFLMYLIPVFYILLNWKEKRKWIHAIQLSGLFLVVICIAQIMYAVLRLSPLFHMVAQKNLVFIYSFSDWMSHPFRFLEGNLKGLFDWMIHYLTVPVFIISFLPILSARKYFRQTILLIMLWMIPFFALALFGKVLYPRFILFMIMPLYITAAVFLRDLLRVIPQPYFRLCCSLVFIIPSIIPTWSILTTPLVPKIPAADKGQIVDDWPAGGGIREINQILSSISDKGKIAVFTDGTFGLLPYALEIYQVDNPNIEIIGIWPVPMSLPAGIVKKSQEKPVYFVANQVQTEIPWPMTLIAEYPKSPNSKIVMRLYKITPLSEEIVR